MAHGITETDQMFSVREKPWHGLGVILPELATAKEAIAAANLGWEVKKVPCWFEDPDSENTFHQVDRRYVTVRMDTKTALGTVGEDYHPLQNIEAFNWMDELCQDPGGPKYVTAGSLHQGCKVWRLVKMPSFIEVTGVDAVEEYLLLSNTHDGSKRVEVLWTPVRVVCQNTLSLALKGQKNKARFKHVKTIGDRMTDARAILGIAEQNHMSMIETIDVLKSFEPTKDQVDTVLKSLFGPTGEREQTHQSDRIMETVNNLFRNGEANLAAGDTSTAWAFYNGITEYSDHFRESKARVKDRVSQKVDSNWYGVSADLKSRALDEVLALK